MACEGCEAQALQLDRLEKIIALQNGAMDEIGKLMGNLSAGMVAKVCAILARHGVVVDRPQRPLQ